MCGSDGKLYASECLMREEQCHKQQAITAVPLDNCEGTSSVLSYRRCFQYIANMNLCSGLYLTGVRGFDPPQEVADPQKVLQNLFGGRL